MRYCDLKLGNTVQDVLHAFYHHPGQMNLQPFGFDVHQGFEFFQSATDAKLYRKLPGAMIEMSAREEQEMVENLAGGAVEFYLRRPTAGLPPYPMSEKQVLHAATGRAIPME